MKEIYAGEHHVAYGKPRTPAMNSLEEIALKVADETDAYCEAEMQRAVDNEGAINGDYREFRDKEFARRLVAALGAQTIPVAWSVTMDGVHTGNIKPHRYEADEMMARLNIAHPTNDRRLVPLFAAPVLPSVKEGWQMVPKKPTPEMVRASWDLAGSAVMPNGRREYIAIAYENMLAAAPSPQEDK